MQTLACCRIIPPQQKGNGSQLAIRMHLEKARGPTALPTGWIANRQSSPWHFAKFTKPVHTCISRLRDLTENTDYRTWTSTLKSLHLHLVLTAVVCTASGRSLSLRALLISSGEPLQLLYGWWASSSGQLGAGRNVAMAQGETYSTTELHVWCAWTQ